MITKNLQFGLKKINQYQISYVRVLIEVLLIFLMLVLKNKNKWKKQLKEDHIGCGFQLNKNKERDINLEKIMKVSKCF